MVTWTVDKPKTAPKSELVDNVHALLETDRRLTLTMIASKVNVNKVSVRSIITTDLGKRKIYLKF
jgi:hypothetical protein